MDRSDSRYCVHCQATFHRSCVIDHFYRNKYCPVCNKKMSLIFMRFGEPPQSTMKKRSLPNEIRKPKWPQLERRTEVPVFEIDIPTGPLKRTDKYIPKARGKRQFKLPKKLPMKFIGIVFILAVIGGGAYFGRSYLPTSFGTQEEQPTASPWTVVWTYPLEGVTDMAASPEGIVVGSRQGLVIFAVDGSVLWQREGEITDVDINESIIAVTNRGYVEMYTIEGTELVRYGEGFSDSVSLSSLQIAAAGSSQGGITFVDTDGNVLQKIETGPVTNVSFSENSEMTAYRQEGTVYVLDILGDVMYAFDDQGSAQDRIILLSQGRVFAQAAQNVFLYDGETDSVLWSAEVGTCSAGLSVSEDGGTFAVCGQNPVLYNSSGQEIHTLPKGSCGSIAFVNQDVVVSDSNTIYFLRYAQPTITTPPEEEGEKQPEESEEPGEQPSTELGTYQEWFTWYQSFLSTEGNSATYSIEVKEGESVSTMEINYMIEGKEEKTVIESFTIVIKTQEAELKSTFKRWIGPDGTCLKAEMTIDTTSTAIDCSKTTIQGVDLREILSFADKVSYVGQEEVTVGRGTFLCHKLEYDTGNGIITLWISDGMPPIKVSLQQGERLVTMSLE
ncbi:MAG: hypothetical protein HXS52_06135 [Theionarchaea archaeon]|nr:hypothetical protein [Theionarchaea archaeon]